MHDTKHGSNLSARGFPFFLKGQQGCENLISNQEKPLAPMSFSLLLKL